MTDPTDADRFEIVEVSHRVKPIGEDAYYEDETDSVSIDRWSKYGNDRLYLNDLEVGDGYLDLQTGDSDGDRWTKVSADYDTDGDELTIEVGRKFADPAYVIVVRVHGDGFEATEDDDADDLETEESEPELVADGGEAATEHVSEESVDSALGSEGTDDERAVLRDALADVQASVQEYWGEWMQAVEEGSAEVVAEDDDAIVLADHSGYNWGEELDALDVPEDWMLQAVQDAHLAEARDRTDWDWSASDPFVVTKRGTIGHGELLVEAIVNSLLRRGCSPGQAWAYYGVEIRGNSRNAWSKRCGYSDHSAISEPLRKAEEKLAR